MGGTGRRRRHLFVEMTELGSSLHVWYEQVSKMSPGRFGDGDAHAHH